MFSGNTADVTTVEHIVTTMEARYGKSDRIWVMDRGMVREDKLDFLRKEGRRYIVGTPKSMLKEFEAELLKDDWNSIRDGLEVKLCSRPGDGDGADSGKDAGGKDAVEEDKETFLLCRSRDRSHKEEAIVGRFEQKSEARLVSMTARCEKQNRDPMKVERENRSPVGPEHAGGQVVRGNRRESERRRSSHRVEESRSGSRPGDVECGLLLASQQRHGLER